MYEAGAEPLKVLTEQLYIEPEQWLGWNAAQFVDSLAVGQCIFVDGIADCDWDSWRQFLREFEAASRSKPSDTRPLIIAVARGIPRARFQLACEALAVAPWSGVIGELDTMTYIDQRLRARGGTLPKHHKIWVRQIAALAVWDLAIADFLLDLPERELFSPFAALRAAHAALMPNGRSMTADWHTGGKESFDGIELLHPFVLLSNDDPNRELDLRIWTAQASELLPLIEIRRRELLKPLRQQLPPLLWFDNQKLDSLEDLEIGSLAHVAKRERGVSQVLREHLARLARYRNSLAHLETLGSDEMLDSRLYASLGGYR